MFKKLFLSMFLFLGLFSSNDDVNLKELAKKELRNELVNYLHFFIENKYIVGAEKLTPDELEKILDVIVNSSEIAEHVIPVMCFQIVNKQNEQVNKQTLKLNNYFDLWSNIVFFGSVTLKCLSVLFSSKKPDSIKPSNLEILFTSGILTGAALSSFAKIWKYDLLCKQDSILEDVHYLKERKIELNNYLMNTLLNAINDAVGNETL
jgi:hypothetical protein